MTTYQDFLASKERVTQALGFEAKDLGSHLYPFQRDIVQWACRMGRAALFEDCGLGKSPQQLEWARQVVRHSGGPVLILAPLAVAQQTVREGSKFGIDCRYLRADDGAPGIVVANYEMLEHFDADRFSGVVLDESSILKSQDGRTRTAIIRAFARTPYRLACTATPSPNDFMELGNHSEFLGVMSRTEMLSMFFVHDGGSTQDWRIKGHAQKDFWKWVCGWAVMIRKPSDIGYEDGGFTLPPMNIRKRVVAADHVSARKAGFLFAMEAQSLNERRAAKRGSIGDRVAACAEIVAAEPSEQFLIWCNLNDEGDGLEKAIQGAVQVSGADSREFKEDAIEGFVSGRIRVLVSKASMFGFGLNLQGCARMAFVGLSDSFEEFYQAVRRCWRFGQTRAVDVHVVTSRARRRDRRQHRAQGSGHAADGVRYGGAHAVGDDREHQGDPSARRRLSASGENAGTEVDPVGGLAMNVLAQKVTDRFAIYNGDSCEVIKAIPDNSIDYSIFSPPFASLYTYSASDRDMGNCPDGDAFAEHMKFLIGDLFRVMKPGRVLSFHCMLLPTSKSRDGYIGLSDFRGDLIRSFQAAGFIFHSEVVIWKDPVTAMQRTKALGLLHKTIRKDSAMSRQGVPDYLVTMRKPGVNPDPITHDDSDLPVELWQKYASPVWMDINPSKTLQKASAREEADERHVCPLQLDVIERAIHLWSRPSDLVLSPFAGIGSEGYQALKMGRRFVGCELKGSYYKQAAANLEAAEKAESVGDLFERSAE